MCMYIRLYMYVYTVDEEAAKNQPIDTTRMFVFDWNLRYSIMSILLNH